MNQLQPTNSKTLVQVLQVNEDLLGRFIAFIDARPTTTATYSRSLRLFFQWLADNSIDKPQRADLILYRDQLKQELQPASVNAYVIAIRQFFKWTETEGLYPNIAHSLKGAKIEREHKKDPLTSGQVREVLAEIDRSTVTGARDYAILATMTAGGLRTIEVARANVEDLRALGGHTVLYIQGKGKDQKSDFIKIPEPAEQAIRAYLVQRGKVAGTDPLFASDSNRNSGGRLTTRSLSRIVKERLLAVGLDSDRLTAHSLRHTAATLNLLAGGSLEETQQLLRHSKIDTTMIYSHHINRLSNDSENRIASAIWG